MNKIYLKHKRVKKGYKDYNKNKKDSKCLVIL